MSRWGSTGVFDSSQLTAVKQTRNVYANALAQRTAVENGKPFMRIQSASAGEGGPVNGFSIASDTGAINLTQAEFDAIVAQETPGPSGPTTLTFTYNGITGTQLPTPYTVPAGYTSLAYILCGGGGAGAGSQGSGGGGGGSGGFLQGSTPVSSGQSISITFGLGGPGAQDVEDISGGDTELIVGLTPFTAGGGGGGLAIGTGGYAGVPTGVAGSPVTSLTGGGYKGGNGATGGGGGGGGGCGINAATEPANPGSGGGGSNGASPGTAGVVDFSGSGGDGFYSLIFT